MSKKFNADKNPMFQKKKKKSNAQLKIFPWLITTCPTKIP